MNTIDNLSVLLESFRTRRNRQTFEKNLFSGRLKIINFLKTDLIQDCEAVVYEKNTKLLQLLVLA